MSNNGRISSRSRRQDAPAQDAQADATVQEQQAAQDAPATDAPATDEQDTQVPATPGQDAPAEPPAQPGAPATEDAPAPAPAQDAPDAGAAAAVHEPDAPGDGDAPDGGSEQGPAEERREPDAEGFLQVAASTDPGVAQDVREHALAMAAGMMLRGLLAQVDAMPVDQPLTGDWMLLHVSGANGRGVAGARAALQVIAALLGSGFYQGSTHGSIKGTAMTAADRQMKVYAFVPDIFRPAFTQLMLVLNAEGGVVWRAEQIKRKAQLDHKKLHGLPAGWTDYKWVNDESRKVMVATGGRIAAQVAAMFPADDAQLDAIRKVLACNAAARARFIPDKNAVAWPATDRYDAPPAPATVPAQVLASAQA